MLGKDKNALALTYGLPDTSASSRKQKIQQLRHKQRYSTETHYIGDNILSSGINNFGIGIYLERIIQEYFLVKKMATLSTYQQDTKNAVDIILKNESLKIGVDITSSSSYEGLNTNELEKKKTKILSHTNDGYNGKRKNYLYVNFTRNR